MNPHANPTLENLRFNMIEQQIRPWDVHDPAVLALLNEIHREDYTPEAHRTLSFFDMELPLGDGSVPGEIMLAPKIEARTLNDLKVQKHETVLEIGTGSGFMAALLASSGASVLTLEINPEIAATARETLRRNGVRNVEVRVADGSKPLPSGPTFDVIVLSGSVAKIPQNLLGSLKIGGRLAAIVGQEPMMRMHFVTRTGEGQWSTAQPWDTVAPRLLNFPEPSRFAF
ncbi:protein-L-isoaspartate O-methyltransferase [Variovorax rhizosphaerae]|uniref:Protein-L-isoaspartate O-methyltransferase n=1 Tax=Variovorax rhizosphaerae TaxID=1836200 RepID=A0ABU8WFG1_9BURK